MKHLLLERQPTTSTHVEGFLSFDDEILTDLERPWIDDGYPGGKPRESCVPAGIYDLVPHARPNGDLVVALVNPDLGVYRYAEDRPDGRGRYLILIHVGNWVHDIVGCIAPGLAKTTSPKGRMVTKSRKAMRRIMDFIDGDQAELEIRWIL